MYNTDLPRRVDLPSSGRLLWSTFVAFAVAMLLLVTIILPSEYAIDPTGIGRMLGLTQMGEIKTQLAEEAAADAHGATAQPLPLAETSRLDAIERQLDQIMAAVTAPQTRDNAAPTTPDTVAQATTAPAATPAPPAEDSDFVPPSIWRDEIEITLQPGQGVELKLVMAANAEAEFEWTANGSVLNFDTHGDGGGQSVSYEKGRGVAEQAGVLRAAFSGNHGWFWRNRTDAPVTLTLRTRGDYSELKRTA